MTRDRDVYRWSDGRLEGADEEAEQLALELLDRGLDWLSAVTEATRIVAARGPRGSHAARRGSPGKVTRTLEIAGVEPAVRAATDRTALQAKGSLDADSEEELAQLRDEAARAIAGAGGPLPYLDIIQAAFGHHLVDHVQAHTGASVGVAVRAMGAEAFASDGHVAFADAPSLFTAAHEAAHVVQQAAGVDLAGGVGRDGDRYERHADEVAERVVRGQSAVDLLDTFVGRPAAKAPTAPAAPKAPTAPAAPKAQAPTAPKGNAIQLRRLPPNIEALLTAAAGGADGPNFAANAAGVDRLIARALAELNSAQRTTVETTRRGALTEAQFLALPRREQLSRTAQAITTTVPSLTLGDPALINTGPTTAAQIANLNTLVTYANNRFTAIAGGTYDSDIDSVFGAANRAEAKTRYANAGTRMNHLHGVSSIVTDRSGYNAEVGLGGLTGANRISLSPTVMDNPGDTTSIIIMIHESLHAGNPGVVTDRGYLLSPGFESMSETDKLGNAAHYEVPLYRVLLNTNPRAYRNPHPPPEFLEFVPAGAVPSGGGAAAPLPTISEQAARAASEIFRKAWTLGLNLHNVYQRLYTTPTAWTTPQTDFASMPLDASIPFWSKVCKLTVHEKTTINPASANPAEHPISQIDMALSEGLTRGLSRGMGVLRPLGTDALVQAFETANATPAELAAAFPGGTHSNADTERDLLIRLVLRHANVGELTGPPDRDFRAVNQLASMSRSWSDILTARPPSAFAD